MVYIGSGDGSLDALNSATGETLWTFDTGEAVDSAPTVGNGIVYFTSRNDELIAVRADSGAEVWRFPAANGWASPVLANNTVSLSGNDDSVYALDPATGEQRWAHDLGATTGRTPAYADDTVYAGTEDGQLVALDAETGDERWRFQGDTGLALSTVIDGNTVYQSIRDSETNALYALDVSDGTEKWRFQTASDAAVGIPTVHGDQVYTAADDGQFYALDASNGVVQWAVSRAAPWQADAKLANGVLYIYNPLAETLFAFDADTGQVIWSLEGYPWYGKGPAIVDGILYSGTDDGIVYAIGERDQPVAAASPQPFASPVVTSAGPGQIELIWSTTGTTEHPLALPQDIAIAPSGEIYVLNPTENNFSVFSSDGDFTETWGEEGTGPGQFHFYGPNLWIGGIDFDAAGAVIDTSQTDYPTSQASGMLFYLTIGPDDTLYLPDWEGNRLLIFDKDGKLVDEISEIPGFGKLISPVDIELDADGFAYITLENANGLLKVKLPARS